MSFSIYSSQYALFFRGPGRFGLSIDSQVEDYSSQIAYKGTPELYINSSVQNLLELQRQLKWQLE
jgi:hypothetical protein